MSEVGSRRVRGRTRAHSTYARPQAWPARSQRRPPRAPPPQGVPHGGFRAQPPYFKESVAHSNRARPEHVEANRVDGQEARNNGALVALAHTRARNQALAPVADVRR